jgi:hypothetical protein
MGNVPETGGAAEGAVEVEASADEKESGISLIMPTLFLFLNLISPYKKT